MTTWTNADIPSAFAAAISQHRSDPGMPSGPTWLARLPRLANECLTQWDLDTESRTRFGQCAVVLPVRRTDGSPAALKIGWPHDEATYEHLALRAWDGAGAVRLLAADPSRWALLLERLDADRDLDECDVDESCRQIGLLIRRLDQPALPALDRLSAYLQRLAGDLDRPAARRPTDADVGLPRRLLERGRAIATDLGAHPGIDARLVHTDLHGQNVLRRPSTGAWAAIDPKPMAGVPEFAVAPALWNRWPEVLDSRDDVRAHLNRRVDTLCERAGLDPDLAKALSVARMLRNALSALQDPGPSTRAKVTICVTVTKAMLPG